MVGPEVSYVATKTWWRCLEGHEWEAPYNGIQQGKGCPVCSGNVPKTAKDYHELAKSRGFEWLGSAVSNVSTKIRWKCGGGHEWEAPYNGIQQGRGCPICAGNMRLTPRDYYELAERRGFEWLGPEVPNNFTKTRWRCFRGHEWEAFYNNISKGRGCPACGCESRREKKKLKPSDYHKLVESRDLKWLGPEAPNVHTNTRWQCAEGHEWETTYHSIQNGGCPECSYMKMSEKYRLKPSDYRKLAESRGFEWLGPEVPNNSTKTWWRCSKGHEWEAIYNSILRGSGCPTCVDIVKGARVSRSQRQLCKLLDGELNYPFGRKRIDVALIDKKIAVEYDSWYWHGHRQEDDARRDKELIEAGWKVLHIKTNTGIPSKQELDDAIAKLENGETLVEIILDDWEDGLTFADMREVKKIDPWEKGPIPISFDGGMTIVEAQQLALWEAQAI